MLVVISDLHFGDGTATDNIPPRDFALLLDHVLDLAEHGGASQVTLLFLGDIFDLLRSEHWFYPAAGEPFGPPPTRGGAAVAEPFPLAHRPWGSADVLADPKALTPECEMRAKEIASAIIATCQEQLDILSGRDLDLASVDDEPLRRRVARKLRAAHAPAAGPKLAFERLYLPGNHDRLARVLPGVCQLFLHALRASPAPEVGGLVRFDDMAVVARHGHEYDGWNFEPVRLGAHAPEPVDFPRTPLGDPITTECLARLPYEVRWKLAEQNVQAHIVDAVYDHLRGIEDVRPLGAVLRWVTSAAKLLEQSTGGCSAVLATIDQTARSLVPRLLALPYAKAWVRRRLFRARFADALKVLALALLCRVIPIRVFARLLEWRPVASWLASRDDALASEALGMLEHEAGGAYAVFGHTHDFRHVPLRAPPGGEQQVYFNSGTWRPRVYEARARPGFIRAKDMSYVVFYDAAKGSPPGYEAWSGAALG